MSAFLRIHKTFSCNLYLYIHHVLIFYASNWRCCRNWKTWWNVLAYFCCKWIFRIIFASINLYYSLKICLNNKWCFIRFLILIKFYYFSVFKRHNYITKIFIFTLPFMRLKFVFCCKGMKVIQAIDINNILLIMLIIFTLQDNTIVVVIVSLKTLKEWLAFDDLSYVLKDKQDVFFFLAYKTSRAIIA